MNEAEKRIREALADEALHDEGASVSDTLYAAHVFEEACSPENIAALLADRDEREARLTRERDEARAERDALAKALDTIHSWLVCAAIASAEDMAQSFAEMEQIAAAALAQIEQEKNSGSR